MSSLNAPKHWHGTLHLGNTSFLNVSAMRVGTIIFPIVFLVPRALSVQIARV